jgi:hypothetical protein
VTMRLLQPDGLCKQDAVYWAFTGVDEFNHPTYAAPVLVKVRWEERSEQYLARENRTLTSKAMVNTDVDITEGGALLLLPAGVVDGGFDPSDLPNPGNPFDNSQYGPAWEVQRFDKLPTIDADQFLRTSFL